MKRLAFFLVIFTGICAQAQFTEISSQFGIVLTGNTVQSGCGVSMYDFDHDGWDDLTVGQPFNPILAYRNNNGMYEIAAVFDNNGDPKSIQWVDYDNDGDSDFFFSVLNQSCKLYRNDGALQFTNVTDSLDLPITNGRSFGCAWGDYDNDGFLDVYISNYSTGTGGYSNWLLHNNGDGGFTNVTAAMGVGNGIKPTYQCAWVDVNLDGLLDLYVVNDFDWLNELYLNNGSTFDAVGAAYGLDVAMEGMSNSWSDFDSDGDFDVFVSNNLDGNVLMRNDAGLFGNIAAGAGVQVNSTCWGSLWMDYDHDGYDDLHVSTSAININGNQNFLFHNNGDYTFADSSMTGDALIVFASAKGDQNNDGWWDFVEMRQYPAAIALWQNEGGSNHWLKFGLTGTASNREGVGAIVRYYYPGKQGLLQTHSGEGYLDQDSQWEIISMAESDMLDSLTVTWPSGWVDHYYNLDAESVYTFVEGETYTPYIDAPGGLFLCESGGMLQLSASPGSQYLWSNDSTSQTIDITEPGIYNVEVTNEFGIVGVAEIEVDLRMNITIDALSVMPSCHGNSDGCISFSSPDGEIADVIWSVDLGEDPTCVFDAGIYSVTITDGFGCEQEVTVELLQPDLLVLNVSADTVCYGGQTALIIEGFGGTGDLQFYYEGDYDPSAVSAGSYWITMVDDNSCAVISGVDVEEYPELVFEIADVNVCPNYVGEIEYIVEGGVGDYVFNWNGFDPEVLAPGDYEFSVTDGSSCVVTDSVSVNEYSEMQITGEIQQAQGGDNGSILITVTGGTEPYVIDWANGSSDNPLTEIGQGLYSVTVYDANNCEATEEFAVIDLNVDETTEQFLLYPNPCDELITLKGISGASVSVFDGRGQLVLKESVVRTPFVLNTSHFAEGLYVIQVGRYQHRFTVKH